MAQLTAAQLTTFIQTLKGVVANAAEGDDGTTLNNLLSAITGPLPSGAAPQDLAAGGGAVNITSYYTSFDSDAGGDALTLADGEAVGTRKKIQMIVDGGGAGTLTPTTLVGGTTITFADAGDFVILEWIATGWIMVEAGNAVDGVSAPVLA